MNTKTQHTPGPWHVASVILPAMPGHESVAVWDETHRQPHGSINGKPWAIVSPVTAFNEEDESNARLIAAAPELLEHLAASLDRDDWGPLEWEAWNTKAKELVSKAKGKP